MQEAVRTYLRVLGPFAVIVEGQEPSDLRITSRKGCALLAYLALHPEQCVGREHLATLLWGDRPEANARQCLRQCILGLRRDLGLMANDVLSIDADRIGLNAQCVAVDAVEFKTHAQSPVEADLLRAAELFRGEFLSGLNIGEPFDAWVRKARSELDNLAADVFQDCAKLADAREDAKQALTAVERLTEIDALREDWQRLALQIYARYRGRGFAMRYAESLVAHLAAELGVDPEPATQTLIDDIARGEIVAVSRSFSPSPDTHSCGIEDPSPIDHFVGSAQEHGHHSDWFAAHRAAVDRAYASMRPSSFGAVWSIALALLVGLSVLAFLRVGRQTWSGSSMAASETVHWLSPSGVASHHNGGRAIPPTKGVLSIVVLPFTTDGDATEANHKMSDGVTDDLINVLSRSEMLRVISRQTAFSFQGHAVDIGAIGAELGVRYVVEGSVRYVGPKAAINVDLVDTADQMQVWADRIEWDTSDRATTQDELTTRIANELSIGATLAEGVRSAQAGEPDMDALLTQGLAAHYRGLSPENIAEELALFDDALRRAPDREPAMIGVAMSLTSAVLNSLSAHPEADLDRADELLDRAMQTDPNSYRVYFWKGLVFQARRNYDAAYEMLSKSIDIYPAAPYAHAHLGDVLVKLGRPQEGLEHIRLAIRLSPKDPFAGQFYISAAEAELELHHEDAAIEWLQSAIASEPHNPNPYKYLAATYALLGDKADAARYWDEFRKLSVAPGVSRIVDRVKAVVASSAPHAHSRLIQGLSLVSQFQNS